MLTTKMKWLAGAVLVLMLFFPPCVRKGVWVDWQGAGEVAAATNTELDHLYFGTTPHYAWIGGRPFTTTREDRVTVSLRGVTWMLVADTSSVASGVLALQLAAVVIVMMAFAWAARPQSERESTLSDAAPEEASRADEG